MTTLLSKPRPKPWTIDEFMAMPDSVGFELVDGGLTERKSMGALSDYVAAQIIIAIGYFCKQTGAGHVFGAESTYRCFGNPNTGRRADVSFIAKGRLTDERIPEGYITVPANLVIEVVSPNDLAYEVEDKVALYLSNGFDEVWVIYPNTQSLHVHRKGASILHLEGDQKVEGRGPLAGFSCVLSDLFPPK